LVQLFLATSALRTQQPNQRADVEELLLERACFSAVEIPQQLAPAYGVGKLPKITRKCHRQVKNGSDFLFSTLPTLQRSRSFLLRVASSPMERNNTAAS